LFNPNDLQLTFLGTDHKHIPVEERERFCCQPETLTNRLKSLANGRIQEAVILSTCNRTEIYTLSSTANETIADLKSKMSIWSGMELARIEERTYTLSGEDAVRHLISVAAGLDSLAIGESQIQEQVRQAIRVANRTGTSGRFLSELFKHADSAASTIRGQTGLATRRISISSAVTVMLSHLAAERKIGLVLLVGAGKMISLAAEDLAELPGMEILVANRTIEKAKEIADRIHGRAIQLSDIPVALEKADVVLTCTSSDDYIIGTQELRKAMERRSGKQLVVLDVAVPRNVNPDAKQIPGLELYDIDDLGPYAQELTLPVTPKLDEARRLAEEEAHNFCNHLRTYEANDLLRDLRKVAEDIREKELSRALRKLGDISDHEKTIVDLLTRRIVNKLLYEPTLRLKTHTADGDGEDYETVIRELFDIGRQTQQ
jgi:glutamyl-tRNA reductase